MTANNASILVVEDDIELADWMNEYFSKHSFSVSVVYTGKDAIEHIRNNIPDLVILDGMLPDIDGTDVCKAVRPTFTNAVIMVTAKDEEIDEVLGLEMGADEYLTKPVRARALLTRIKKLLEKQNPQAPSQIIEDEATETEQVLSFGQLTIDKNAMIVSLDGQTIETTTNETELLWILAKNAGKTISRSELIRQVRGFEYDGFDRSIDLKISRLRKKLGDAPNKPTRIKTIWGKGYLFVKGAW